MSVMDSLSDSRILDEDQKERIMKTFSEEVERKNLFFRV